jgi:hypothetical protein
MTLEVEDELARDGFHHCAAVAEEKARAVLYCGSFEEGIRHAGDGLHGVNAGANTCRGETRGAQVAELAQLDEILKAVGVGKGN